MTSFDKWNSDLIKSIRKQKGYDGVERTISLDCLDCKSIIAVIRDIEEEFELADEMEELMSTDDHLDAADRLFDTIQYDVSVAGETYYKAAYDHLVLDH